MNNSKKIKWKQSYATFRGKSTKYRIYKKNTKHVLPYMKEKLQKHYLKMKLPDNLIWDPLGYGGRGSLRQKRGVVDASGLLRTKYEHKHILNSEGYLIPRPCLHEDDCPDIQNDPQWHAEMSDVCDTYFMDVPPEMTGMSGYYLIEDRLPPLFKKILRAMKCFQYRIIAEGLYSKAAHPTVTQNLRVSTKRSVCQGSTNIKQEMKDITQALIAHTENKETNNSGYVIQRVYRIQIDFCIYQPIEGSSWVPLPIWFKGKNSVVNPQNKKDNECFKWCCCIHEFHMNQGLIKRNAGRIAPHKKLLKKGHQLNINMDGLTYPVTLDQLPKFEKNNPQIVLNVFGYTDPKQDELDSADYKEPWAEPKNYRRHIHNMYRTSNDILTEGAQAMNLLLVEKQYKDEFVRHFCYIKKMSGLKSGENSNHQHKVHMCQNCCNFFSSAQVLENHMPNCIKYITGDDPTPIMPDKDFRIKFKDWAKTMKADFCVYADFEAFLEHIDGCEPEPTKSYTVAQKTHKPCSFGYFVQCRDTEIQKQFDEVVIYREEGKDIALEFVKKEKILL